MVRVIPIIDRGPKLRRIAVTIGLFLLFFSLLLFVVLKTYSLYSREGKRGAHNMITLNNASSVQPDVTFSPADLVDKDFIVDVELLDMKPDKSELSLSANVTRLRYSKQKGTLLLGSYKTIPLNRSMYFMDKKITLELTNGDISKYPYDEYVTEIPFAGYVGASKDFVKYITNATDEPPKEFEYAVIVHGHLNNWKFGLKWSKHEKLQGINILRIRIKRSASVKFFSMLVVGMMWFMTLGAVTIAMQIIVRDHKMIPWNISLFSALLFAMPRVRNIQPNIPTVGTLADTVGLIFNMALISLCQITMMIRWVLQTPGPNDEKQREKQQDDNLAIEMAMMTTDE